MPVFTWIKNHILQQGVFRKISPFSLFSRCVDLASSSFTVMCEAVAGATMQQHAAQLSAMRKRLMKTPEVQAAWGEKAAAIYFHYELTHHQQKAGEPFVLSSFPSLTFHRQLVVLEKFPRSPLAVPFNWVLNTLDKMESKYHLFTYAAIADECAPFKGKGFFQLTKEIYSLCDQLYENIGSDASVLYKALESLCVGVVLENCPSLTNDTGFIGRILDDLKKDDLRVYASAEAILSLLRKVIKDHAEEGVSVVLEQYGQEKLHYYPVGEEQEGLDKMYKYTHQLRDTDPESAKEVRGMFLKRFIKAYYAKENILPVIVPLRYYHPEIVKMLITGVCPSSSEMDSIPLLEWARIRMDKTFEFDYLPDPLDLMDDKSSAPPVHQQNWLYNKALQKAMNLRLVGSKPERRFIQWILHEKHIDIKAWFDEAWVLKAPPPEERLILLNGKELENKIALRMYSILHPKTRLKCSALEKNISNTIYPYFSEQSMTLSGPELISHTDQLSKLLDGKHGNWVVFNLDLTQWNYTYRQSALAPLQLALNELFGVTHFSQMMWPFLFGIFVSGDSFSPPGIGGRANHWNGSLGGNQGICQKAWTLHTQMIIHVALEPTKLKYKLIGSGDNQVVFIELDEVQSAESTITKIKESLSHQFDRAGLELKLAETWHSDSLFAYQRKYYFKGKPCPASLKQSAKTASGTADGANSVSAFTETAMGAGMVLSSVVADPVAGPFLAYLEFFVGLHLNPDWAANLPKSPKRLVSLTFAGAELGFLPVLQLPSFLYAGHQDHLSESLGMLGKIFESHTEYQGTIASLVHFTPGTQPRQHLLELVLNPMAPHIRKPKTIEGVIRAAVEKDLFAPNRIRNVKIKALFSAATPSARDRLAGALLQLKPKNMAVIHSLYEFHAVGQAHSAINKISKVRTLTRAMEREHAGKKQLSFAMEVIQNDVACLKRMKEQLEARGTRASTFWETVVARWKGSYLGWCAANQWAPDCTFSVRMFIMSMTWGLGTELLSGAYCPAPIEQVVFHLGLPDSKLANSIIVSPSSQLPPTTEDLTLTRGPFALYTGTRTKDPVRTMRLVNLEGVEAGKAVRGLAKLLAWAVYLQATGELIPSLISQIDSRVPGLGAILRGTTQTITGGTLDHRFGLLGESMGAYQSKRTLLATWYMLSTNRATQLHRGEEDRFIFFQQLYQFIFAHLSLVPPIRHRFLAEVRMEHCSYPVPPQTLHLDRPIPVPPPNLIAATTMSVSALGDLRQELEARKWVTSMALETPRSQESGLCGFMALKVAKNWREFQLGASWQVDRPQTAGIPQGIFNLSLLRKVSLIRFFQAIVVGCAFRRCFGNSSSRRGSMTRLDALISRDTGAQDFHIFQALIEAIIVAGHLPEMARIVGAPPVYSIQDVAARSTRFTLQALRNAAQRIGYHKGSIPLIVEVKKADPDLKGLQFFLKSWSPAFRAASDANPDASTVELLRAAGGMFPPIHVIITSDSELVLGLARALPAPDDLIVEPFHPCPRAEPKRLTSAEGPPWPLLLWNTQLEAIPSEKTPRHSMPPGHEWVPQFCPAEAIQVARWMASASGAYLKLQEVLAATPEHLPEIKTIWTLAEGGGSMLAYLLHIYPDAVGIFNTLVTPDSHHHGAASGYIPVDLLCRCPLMDRVVNLPYLSEFNGDLTLSGTWEELRKASVEGIPDQGILTWDMEGHGEDREGALERLFLFLSHTRVHLVIIKHYLAGVSPDPWEVLTALEGLEYHPFVVKPLTSSPGNTEVYICGQQRMVYSSPLEEAEWKWWSREAQCVLGATTLPRWLRHLPHLLSWQQESMPCSLNDPLGILAEDNIDRQLHHPLEQVLRYLAEFQRDRPDSMEARERGLQHMTQSKARGATLTQEDMRSIILAYHLMLSMTPLQQAWMEYNHWSDAIKGAVKDFCLELTHQLEQFTTERMKVLHARRVGQLMACWHRVKVHECTILLAYLYRMGVQYKMRDLIKSVFQGVSAAYIDIREKYVVDLEAVSNPPHFHTGYFNAIKKALRVAQEAEKEPDIPLFMDPSWATVVWANLVGATPAEEGGRKVLTCIRLDTVRRVPIGLKSHHWVLVSAEHGYLTSYWLKYPQWVQHGSFSSGGLKHDLYQNTSIE